MAIERTLAIIKPDAVSRGLTGEILARIHQAAFAIVAAKSLRLTPAEAEGFYAVHRERGFFRELTAFMSSGKIIVLVLEADGAIARWRDTMGATDPAKAAGHEHWEQLHAWFRCPRNSRLRDRLLFCRLRIALSSRVT